MTTYKKFLKKFWHFIWEEDSILSWIVNVVLAFILIKFIVYPGLGFMLGTTHPVVAVVSGSMEHKSNFDEWWSERGPYYVQHFNITREEFREYPFKNGFNKGDIMVLLGTDPDKIEIGDVIVYNSIRSDPIIHRTVEIWRDAMFHYATKGDNVAIVQSFEQDIRESQMVGRAVLRVPYLGWVKIVFVCGVQGAIGNDNVIDCLKR